jgi:hypothetical protein
MNLSVLWEKGTDVIFSFFEGSLYSAKWNGLNFVFLNNLGEVLTIRLLNNIS